jgi:hypothetical protein
MKWNVLNISLVAVVTVLGSVAYGFEQNRLLQVNISHQQDTARAFSGVDGLKVQRLETKLSMPLLVLGTHAGDWFSAFEFSENRFLLSGAQSGKRRLYRFSVPFEYEAISSGRWQHFWRFAPSYYSDESIIDQSRYVNEYAWLGKYQVNRKVKWVVGLRQDTRFGVTTRYPVFGLEAQPSSMMYHHWVFPDIYSQLLLPNGNSIRAFMQPSGGNWRYLQTDGTEASLGMMDWNVGLALFKPIKHPLQLKFEVGLNMNGEGTIAGVDGDLDDGYFFLISLQSQLPN